MLGKNIEKKDEKEGLEGLIEKAKDFYFFGFFDGETGERTWCQFGAVSRREPGRFLGPCGAWEVKEKAEKGGEGKRGKG